MGEHLQSAIDYLGKTVVIKSPVKKEKGVGDRGRVRSASLKAAVKPRVQEVPPVVTRLDQLQIKVGAIHQLAEKLKVSEDLVRDVSSISQRTFQRRQAEDQPLTPTEADRVLRIARLAREAERVFGDAQKARLWLTSPSAVLGDVPLRLLGSDAGAREVEEELGRIDWGDFA